jgi:GlpG protein
MQRIGVIQDESHARHFGAHLYGLKIESDIEPAGEGGWAVWVVEDHLDEARAMLERFTADPNTPEFASAKKRARARRAEVHREEKRSRRMIVDARPLLGRLDDIGIGPVTGALIAICVVVALGSNLGRSGGLLQYLKISNYPDAISQGGSLAIERLVYGLPEIKHGQVWRLFTPIIIHFGLIHIIFNMLWLKDLGTLIERKQGIVFFLALVLSFALFSNLGQYMWGGPGFGGMSGVVYGLFGYLWIRGNWDPNFGIRVPQQIVVMMVIWFFICWLGFLRIANMAHTVGLVLGMLVGYVASGRWRRILRLKRL